MLLLGLLPRDLQPGRERSVHPPPPRAHRIRRERILALDDGTVRFRWKDYRQQHRWKTMALPAAEFIRNSESRIIPSSSRKAGGARAEWGIELGIITGY